MNKISIPPAQDSAAELRAELRRLIGERRLAQADVAREIGISAAALNTWVNGRYRGDNERIERLVSQWVMTEVTTAAARDERRDLHVPLGVTERIFACIRHAQANGDLVLVYGAAGAGKSWAFERYRAERSRAHLATMSPAITTPAAALGRVAAALDVAGGPATAAGLEAIVVSRLAQRETVLIVDEAHHLTPALLDQLRCVHDQAGCGLVLGGNEPLWARLAGGERAAQLVSRIGLRRRLRHPAELDAVALAEGLLGAALDAGAHRVVTRRAKGLGGLRAVAKLVGQARVLARGDGRDQATPQDLADAALLDDDDIG